jgi:hypothetical protein
VKLITHLHLVPRSKNAWSYTSTPLTHLSWHGAQLKKAQGQLYLYLTRTYIVPYPSRLLICTCSKCTPIYNYSPLGNLFTLIHGRNSIPQGRILLNMLMGAQLVRKVSVFHGTRQLGTILSQLNLIHSHTHYFFNINFNVILPPIPRHPK